MNEIVTVTRSLRTIRLSSRMPRIVLGLLVFVFIMAGLRATFAPKAPVVIKQRITAVAAADEGASSFAEGFARAYLSWDAKHADERTKRLEPYVRALSSDAGLRPADGTSQQVLWTSVVAERSERDVRVVTVAVQTTKQMIYLSVPVSRDSRGFLSISAYPAIIGPPATSSKATLEAGNEVEDPALVKVVTRALTNYLAGNRENLLADLAPGSLVSPPGQPLKVTGSAPDVTWREEPNRVAVEIDAIDPADTTLTLRYELDVVKRDRWYVKSVHVDPTFQQER